MSKHTPGPWDWRIGSHGRIDLAAPHGGGTTVMDFVRHGMQRAQPRFGITLDNEPRGYRGGVLVELTELVAKDRDGLLRHPDALLIAAAPDLLAACVALVAARDGLVSGMADRTDHAAALARAAIAKAEGNS